MSNDTPERASASGESQKQSASTEKDFKKANKPENSDEIQHFDTTIAKLVERENPDTGETETVEVLSDNLYPGEKLKRADDEEKAAAKAEERKRAARKAAGDKADTDNRDKSAK